MKLQRPVPDGEFDIIREVFAPLTAGEPGAFNLTDDAALLLDTDFVVTKDLLVSGVHFLSKDPLNEVAQKALRVNLSDLAAKGAKPVGYFLGLVWPKNATRAQIETFASGLAADQKTFKIALHGGDTTKHIEKTGPLTISITMFGLAARDGLVRRNGAVSGDDLYVSGTIGDAGLGLKALTAELKPSAADKKYLAARYRLPSPRLSLGGALPGVATAALDVSDGLIADAAHLAKASGVALEINAAQLPLSDAAKRWVATQSSADDAIAMLASAGDDYEILFTAPQARRRAIEMAAQVTKTPVARIGKVKRGDGVTLTGADGSKLQAPGGFDHFAKSH